MSGNPVVDLRDVFSVHRTNEGDAAALQGATLSVSRAESVCVLGASGAGKTTLLRIVAGLLTPSAGVVSVLGQDMGRAPARARARMRHQSLGLLSQHSGSALPPDLALRAAVALPLALRGVGRRHRRRRADELLSAAGLAQRGAARPSALSGGERQRAALCMALSHRPALLLADEPTGELDAGNAEVVLRLITQLARDEGTTVVIVSHDAAAAAVVDRGLRMRAGRVVEELGSGTRGGIVVAPDGWLSLPPPLLRQAGVADRAQVQPTGAGLLVSAHTSAGAAVAAPSRGAPRTAIHGPSHAGNPVAIDLRDVVRAHGRGHARHTVLDGFTHRLAAGRLHAIAGASGSGKTTLLRLVAGIDRPDRGAILHDGHDLAELDPEARAALRRRRIGYLGQEPAPVGFLSAEENVVLALRWRGWSEGQARARATLALERVGLTEQARQRAARLSAGEAQRVALARALATARGLLIVDEPTSRLDETNATMTAELLRAAAHEESHTVLCATHDDRLLARADEIIQLGVRTSAPSRSPRRATVAPTPGG
ncbi:MAG: ATP-binding cassette domain-containing protein [Solirubrobacteraceae bacterium]